MKFRYPFALLAVLLPQFVFVLPSYSCTENCVFNLPTQLRTLESMAVVATGDFNGDGRKDVVAVEDHTNGSVQVFLQDETGAMQVPEKYYPMQSENDFMETYAIGSGDFNGDGRDDVALKIRGGIRLMLQDGFGKLSIIKDIPISSGRDIVVEDFNKDGRLDLAVLGDVDGVTNIKILYQDTSGNFGALTNTPILYEGWVQLVSGDLNGDGLADMAVMSNWGGGPSIAVLLQESRGSFGEPVYYDPAGSSKESLAIGDVNGDGRKDLIMAHGFDLKIVALLQNVNGTFGPPVYYNSGYTSRSPRKLKVIDINNDGREDVLALLTGGAISVHLQNADGALAPQITHFGFGATHPSKDGFAFDDLNGDGRIDAVVAIRTWMGGITVHYGALADLKLTLSPSATTGLVYKPTRYTATIVNQGPDTARDVKFSYERPAEMFTGYLASSQGSCDYLQRTCSLGAMAIGQTATVSFESFSYENVGLFVHSAGITSYTHDKNAAGNSATATINVSYSADLELTTHSVSSESGSIVRYTASVQNSGKSTAENVVITDKLPSGTVPLSASWYEWAGTRSGDCQINGGEVVCRVGQMPVTDVFNGAFPIVINVRAQVNTTDSLDNIVTVGSDTGDPDLKDNRSSVVSDYLGNSVNQAPIINMGTYVSPLGASLQMDARNTIDPEGRWVDFVWTFPDGRQAWDRTARYTFTSTGQVPVTITASDRDGGSATETFYVNVVNTQPVADIGAPYYLRRKNDDWPFDATRSHEFDGGALQFSWDFGDGSFGTGVQPMHAYTPSGVYNVELTVSDGVAEAVATTKVVVINTRPYASMSWPSSIKKNEPAQFASTYSGDADGDPITYFWDFGDGGTSTEANPVYIFRKSGTYTVSLVINDGEDNSLPATRTVTIVNNEPLANGAGPYAGIKNQPIQFDGSASSDIDNDVLSYRWDLGDGTTSTEQAPSHVYTKSGRFKVKLIVNDGEVDSKAYSTTSSIKNR